MPQITLNPSLHQIKKSCALCNRRRVYKGERPCSISFPLPITRPLLATTHLTASLKAFNQNSISFTSLLQYALPKCILMLRRGWRLLRINESYESRSWIRRMASATSSAWSRASGSPRLSSTTSRVLALPSNALRKAEPQSCTGSA